MMDAFPLEVRIDTLDLLGEGHAIAEIEILQCAKACLQCGKPLGRRLRAREFFVIERDAAVLVVDRDQ